MRRAGPSLFGCKTDAKFDPCAVSAVFIVLNQLLMSFILFCLSLACHLFGIVLPVVIAAVSVLRHPVNWRILHSYV